MFYQKKGFQKKLLQSRFKYSPLGSELKKQTCTAKVQYMFIKDQINVDNKNREDGVETEDIEILDDVHHKYIGNE